MSEHALTRHDQLEQTQATLQLKEKVKTYKRDIIPIDFFKVSNASMTLEFKGPFTVELMSDPFNPDRPDRVTIDKVQCVVYPDDCLVSATHNGPEDVNEDKLFMTYLEMLTNLTLEPSDYVSVAPGRALFDTYSNEKKTLKILKRRFWEYESSLWTE